MSRHAIISLILLVGLAGPALAQESETKHYVIVDTVGICSVIDAEPSAGMTPIGNKDGYADEAAAKEYLLEKAKGSDQCKDIIEPV